MADVILQARGLAKTYRLGEVQVQALRGVDLDLVHGELVVLVGPSGSGKSTLLNVMGGLDRPTAGQITVDGRAAIAAMADRVLPIAGGRIVRERRNTTRAAPAELTW